MSGAEAVVTDFNLVWGPDYQEFYHGEQSFRHQGPTDTEPTHDLAHLLIAANGSLLWLPDDNDTHIRVSEYNAVMIEHLLDNCFNAFTGKLEHKLILGNTIKHVRWFVDEHYAPFPIPAEEAYRQWCCNIDPNLIARLSPIFLGLRGVETTREGYRQLEHMIRFTRGGEYRQNHTQAQFARLVYAVLAPLRS